MQQVIIYQEAHVLAARLSSQDAINALIQVFACNAILHSILQIHSLALLVILQFHHAKFVLTTPIVLHVNQDIIHKAVVLARVAKI